MGHYLEELLSFFFFNVIKFFTHCMHKLTYDLAPSSNFGRLGQHLYTFYNKSTLSFKKKFVLKI